MAEHAATLEQEARVFTRALIGRDPSDYVLRQYARGHMALPLAPVQAFDRVLLRTARGAPWQARMADAWARRFAGTSILRRKLTLLLAILESSAPSDAEFAPVRASAFGVVLRLAAAGTAAVFYTSLSLLILGPAYLVHRVAAGRV